MSGWCQCPGRGSGAVPHGPYGSGSARVDGAWHRTAEVCREEHESERGLMEQLQTAPEHRLLLLTTFPTPSLSKSVEEATLLSWVLGLRIGAPS